MSTTPVYRKTPLGAETIAVRQPGLAPRQRSLLILIDGKRNQQELTTLAAGSGDVREMIDNLLAQGLIECLPQPAASVERAAAPQAAAAVPLARSQRHAVRRLNELMGPSATDLCLRVEACRSAQDFQAAIRRVEAVLREVVGPQKAAGFVAEIENLRPA